MRIKCICFGVDRLLHTLCSIDWIGLKLDCVCLIVRGTCSTLCAATLSHSARTRHVHMLPQPGGKRIVQRACQHWSHQLDLMLWFRGGRGGGRHTIVVLLLSGPSSNAAGKAVSEGVETEREREGG